MGINAVRAVPTAIKLRAAQRALFIATNTAKGKPVPELVTAAMARDRDVWKAILRDYQAQTELEKTYG